MGSKSLRTVLVAVLMLGVAAALPAADAPQPVVFPGRVEAAEQTGIAARVAGAVDKVNVDIGDRVKKGQVLIELSAPELKDELDQAEARLEQAKAEVEGAEAATAAAEARVAEADAAAEAARAALKSAKAAADRAKSDADRAREIQNRNVGAISEQDFAAIVHQADAARSAWRRPRPRSRQRRRRKVATAELHRAPGRDQGRPGGRRGRRGRGAEGADPLGYTRVTAPFDGVVTRRTVDTGAVVGPARPGETAPLLTVMRDDVVHVAFDVDEQSTRRSPSASRR